MSIQISARGGATKLNENRLGNTAYKEGGFNMRKWEANSDVWRKKIASAEESDSNKVCKPFAKIRTLVGMMFSKMRQRSRGNPHCQI